MAFFSFLRCSELTITSSFNPKVHPTITDLSVLDNETISYFIKQSKTDQILLHSGIPADHFSSHSFCIGAATAAQKRPLSAADPSTWPLVSGGFRVTSAQIASISKKPNEPSSILLTTSHTPNPTDHHSCRSHVPHPKSLYCHISAIFRSSRRSDLCPTHLSDHSLKASCFQHHNSSIISSSNRSPFSTQLAHQTVKSKSTKSTTANLLHSRRSSVTPSKLIPLPQQCLLLRSHRQLRYSVQNILEI